MGRQNNQFSCWRKQIEIRQLRVLTEEAVRAEPEISQTGFFDRIPNAGARPVAHLKRIWHRVTKAAFGLAENAVQPPRIRQLDQAQASWFQNARNFAKKMGHLYSVNVLQDAV
jgi:hypothetical protein